MNRTKCAIRYTRESRIRPRHFFDLSLLKEQAKNMTVNEFNYDTVNYNDHILIETANSFGNYLQRSEWRVIKVMLKKIWCKLY